MSPFPAFPPFPAEDLACFEDAIFLPMVLTVLERDRMCIEGGPFKVKEPYFQLIDAASRKAQEDLRARKSYMRRHRLKVVRSGGDRLFTEYMLYKEGYEQRRRYLNAIIKKHVEERLEGYFELQAAGCKAH